MAIVMDGSESISAEAFQQELDAVNGAIAMLSGQSQAAVYQFANEGEHTLEQGLEVATSIPTLSFDQLQGSTFWVQPLEEAIDVLQAAQGPDITQLLVLITDGKNFDADPCGPCNDGMCDGIPLLVMAVGGADIQSCYLTPTEDNLFEVDNFAALQATLDEALEDVCQTLDLASS